jgi:hypothetical protein
MQQLNKDSLIAELRAIELWDYFYGCSNSPDGIDKSACERRRERQAEIYEQLFAQGVLKISTRNHAN